MATCKCCWNGDLQVLFDLESSFNGALGVLLACSRKGALKCFWSALGVVLLELELEWWFFRRSVFGGFWRCVPEGFLEGCSRMEEGFRKS